MCHWRLSSAADLRFVFLLLTGIYEGRLMSSGSTSECELSSGASGSSSRASVSRAWPSSMSTTESLSLLRFRLLALLHQRYRPFPPPFNLVLAPMVALLPTPALWSFHWLSLAPEALPKKTQLKNLQYT